MGFLSTHRGRLISSVGLIREPACEIRRCQIPGFATRDLEGTRKDPWPVVERSGAIHRLENGPMGDALNVQGLEQRAVSVELANVDDDSRPLLEFPAERRRSFHLVQAAAVSTPGGGKFNQNPRGSSLLRSPADGAERRAQLRVGAEGGCIGSARRFAGAGGRYGLGVAVFTGGCSQNQAGQNACAAGMAARGDVGRHGWVQCLRVAPEV